MHPIDLYTLYLANHTTTVITATGPGNGGVNDLMTFLFEKPRYMPSTVGTFYGRSPAQIVEGKITPSWLGHGIKGSVVPRHCGDNADQSKMALKPAIPLILLVPWSQAYKSLFSVA